MHWQQQNGEKKIRGTSRYLKKRRNGKIVMMK